MNRRTFIQSAALSGISITTGIVAGCGTHNSNKQQIFSFAETKKFELNEITVNELQNGMENGTYTTRSVVEMYLNRIGNIDKNGPKLNSVIELNPDAIAIADQLDNERKEGKIRGPLHGIPVMIKDNIDTADKMMTTAGSLALLGSIAQEDSFVAAQLRKAGAVLLGKTNLSEWANFRSTRSSSGWSSRGGQTRNPYILDRNPCGSSSGSGAAVSANLCMLTIGTETNGSIVCPSNANGIVGIKPTVGLISRSGIIPISFTQDTAGPMARTVKDAALLLGALTGVDPRDETTRESSGKSFVDYTQFLDPEGLKGTRIGVGRGYMGFHEAVDKLIEEALAQMKNAGAELVDIEDRIGSGISQESFDILLFEFKDGLNRYLSALPANIKVRSLKDIISFNKDHEASTMPYFKQEILVKSEKKGDLKSKEYLNALNKVRQVSGPEGIDKVMDEQQLDAIIAPAGGPAWPIDVINGDHFGGGSSSPAARTGYPNITVPAGFVHGLPVGLSFFGKAYTEPLLLKIAYAYEQLSQNRKAPEFLSTFAMN